MATTGSPETRKPDECPSGPDPRYTEPGRGCPERRTDRSDCDQQAADAIRKAADTLASGVDAGAAVQHFASAKFFVDCAAPQLTSEAAALLDEHERKIRSREIDSRARKNMRYEARYHGQTSSARLYTGSGKKSGFTKKPTVDEQLNEKLTTETQKSSDEQQTNS